MRYESHYRVRLPDHDFPVGRDHKLIPSVYAACVIDAKLGVRTTGPTFISVRSGRHDSSTAIGHADDMLDVLDSADFREHCKLQDGTVTPILIFTVDGGPDENPRFPKTIAAAVNLFKRLDLDCLFVASEAPGHSAYNYVERRMAPLSRDLTGIIIPHDNVGSHLRGGGWLLDFHANFGDVSKRLF